MNIRQNDCFPNMGIPIPQGDVAETPAAAKALAEKYGGKVAVKAQVHIGGRGKAGGVKLAMSPDEAHAHAQAILGMDIKGLTVNKVLIDELAPGGIAKELYLAILIDRAARQPMIMASAEGGMDIEHVNATTPEKIVKVHVNPVDGLAENAGVEIAAKMGLPTDLGDDFHAILSSLYTCFISSDAELTEINPLIITGENKLMALDGKMSIDDNALPFQPRLAAMRDDAGEPGSEQEARKAGINFIQLDGTIGCMVNGAGLAMTTMDVITLQGGSPANFLDIGGGANAEKVAVALKLILSDPKVKAVLINIFGGITKGDEVAKGILAGLEMVETDVPMIVRIAGTNADEGMKILANAEMETAVSLTDGAQKAIAAAQGG